jgi:hypothetical protein
MGFAGFQTQARTERDPVEWTEASKSMDARVNVIGGADPV